MGSCRAGLHRHRTWTNTLSAFRYSCSRWLQKPRFSSSCADRLAASSPALLCCSVIAASRSLMAEAQLLCPMAYANPDNPMGPGKRNADGSRLHLYATPPHEASYKTPEGMAHTPQIRVIKRFSVAVRPARNRCRIPRDLVDSTFFHTFPQPSEFEVQLQPTYSLDGTR